jgi:hypothetical protein
VSIERCDELRGEIARLQKELAAETLKTALTLADGFRAPRPALKRPGAAWRQRENGERALYWIAPRKAVAAGFTPKTVMLDQKLSDAQLDIAAQALHASALKFLSPRSNGRRSNV